MKLRTFVRSFYVFQFFFDFILIYAVEKLFFLNRGINLSQIGILLFFWSVMSLILEVPTGALADRWSRRKMLILSGIFFSICYTIWIFSGSFWLFLLGFFFRTLGGTFTSGTLQAYVFDFLNLHGKESEFEKIWGRGNSLRTLGIGTAVLFGGILSQISYSIPLAISATSVLSVSVIAYFWPELKSSTSTGEEKYWELIKGSLRAIRQNNYLLRIMLYSACIFSVFATLEEFNDVYLRFLGFPNSVIGIVFALATIGQSVGSALAHRLKNQSWLVLNLSAMIGIVILLLAAIFRHPVMAIGILFLGIMLEFSRVLNEGVIQREVPEGQRATISSVNSFVSNLIPLQLVFGFMAYRYNLQWSYAFLAIFAITYFPLILIVRKGDSRSVERGLER
jgi:MFS family permease